VPAEYICRRPDVDDPIAVYHKRGVAYHRVRRIDRQRELEMLDKNAHSDNLCAER
jgi:hypothetical protein